MELANKEIANGFIESYLAKIDEKEESLKKAVKFFKKEKFNYKPFEYLFDYEIAKISHYHLGDNRTGEKYYFEALKNIPNDDVITKGEIYFCLGNLYKDSLEYSKSNKYFFDCLDIYKNLSDLKPIEYKEICYRRIGANYEDENDYDKAIEFYLKGDKISRKTQYSGISLFLLGSLYSNKLDDEKTALNYAEKAEKLLKEKIYIVGNYRLLGHLHLMLKNYAKAISYCEDALNKYPDQEYVIDFYTILGKIYCNWHKEEKGIQYFNLALASLKNNDPEYEERYVYLNSWMALAEEGRKNLKKALDISTSIIEKYKSSAVDLIFPITTKGRVLQKSGNFLDGYSFLNEGLKNYEKSRFFDKSDSDYIEALDIKNELYKKLPILNKFFERFKN